MNLNKDINHIVFDNLSLPDKYNFYCYCIENGLVDELDYFQQYFNSLYNYNKDKWCEILINNEHQIQEDLLEKYKENIDWFIACAYQTFSEDFIIKHKKYIDWRPVILQQKLTSNIIEAYKKNIDWIILSSSPLLTEDLIFKYEDKIVWNCVTLENPSDKLLQKYKDKLYWFQISFTDINRYNDYEDYVDWQKVSYHNILTEDFIRKNKDRLNWGFISSHQKLSNEFIEEFKDKVNLESINLFNELTQQRTQSVISPILPFRLPRRPLPLLRQTRYRPNRPSFFDF